jgi:AbrB family looped-hinge helix DNA binding protein
MPSAQKFTVRLSTKGHVILPKSIRQRWRWDAGTRLIVEDTADGVLLKAAPSFKPTKSDKVFGSLKVSGPPKTLKEMDAGVLAEEGVAMLAIDTNVIVRWPRAPTRFQTVEVGKPTSCISSSPPPWSRHG